MRVLAPIIAMLALPMAALAKAADPTECEGKLRHHHRPPRYSATARTASTSRSPSTDPAQPLPCSSTCPRHQAQPTASAGNISIVVASTTAAAAAVATTATTNLRWPPPSLLTTPWPTDRLTDRDRLDHPAVCIAVLNSVDALIAKDKKNDLPSIEVRPCLCGVGPQTSRPSHSLHPHRTNFRPESTRTATVAALVRRRRRW